MLDQSGPKATKGQFGAELYSDLRGESHCHPALLGPRIP